ncbi:MAG: insulinase family protein [Planctomycetes bacterium]|nr:insulinase family protein [Planctomycetota bacterium]
MRLHLAPTDKFKTVVTKLFLRADLEAERATETALLPYVLRHGTRALPSMQALNEACEQLFGASLGVDILKLGEQQVVTARIEVVGDAFLPKGEGAFAPALALLEDLFFDPQREGEALTAAATRQEREKLERFISSLINDKATYAAESCVRHMCADEPYGVFEYGRLEDLPQIDGARLEARRAQLLATAPLDVYVVGAFDADEVRAALVESFALSRPDPAPLRGTTRHPPAQAVREIHEPMAVKQGKLCMGFRSEVRVEDPEYWALLLMNGVLGAFPHSKLFKNVREKAGLCYDASSNLERFKGLVLLSAGIDRERFAETRDTCLAQLEAIARGEISEDELLSTQRSYQQGLEALLDSPSGLVNLDYALRLGGRDGRPGAVVEELGRVTPAQIAEAAQRVHLDTVYFLEPTAEPSAEEPA